MQQVLVLGFSVTAENPGYIEKVQAILQDNAGVALRKIGLGGMQPFHLRHLLEEIVDDFAPDHVVAEFATPGFRQFSRLPADHKETVNSLLHLCAARGISLSFLDLPRADVNAETDWVYEMHAQACRMDGLTYRKAPEKEGLLRDVVHPTPEGVDAYAESLLELLEQEPAVPVLNGGQTAATGGYGAINIGRALCGGSGLRTFSRGGYEVSCFPLPAGEAVTLELEAPVRICGMNYLMGPRTGTVRLSNGAAERLVRCYDQFCYYERLGSQIFEPVTWDRITFEQLPELPEVPLLKGEADNSERCGHVVHLLTLP